MSSDQIIPHLFRAEFSRITAVLCRSMGIVNLETAEDVASETFLAALETWPYNGIPANPVAWLYKVARHKAINLQARQRHLTTKIIPGLSHTDHSNSTDIAWSEEYIRESQLAMLFVICNPVLSKDAQVCLALRLLCGLGPEEIAVAFLTSVDTIQKRLYRARTTLANAAIKMELPGVSSITQRLPEVLKTLYLFFNEGYYSETNDAGLRKEWCREAIRITTGLLEQKSTTQPAVHALLALLCFQASRLDARLSGEGDWILYEDQDENLWDKELIAAGAAHLHAAGTGTTLTSYHLEAMIAYWHTNRTAGAEKWKQVVRLYDLLLQLHYSPIAALNRVYALYRLEGATVALAAALPLPLTGSHFYHLLLGELYSTIDRSKAIAELETALQLARTKPDRASIIKRLDRMQING